MRRRPAPGRIAGMVGLVTAATLALAGCSTDGDDGATHQHGDGAPDTSSTAASSTAGPSTAAGTHEHGGMQMEHPMDGGPAPAGIVTAEHPRYAVGSEVVMHTDHMPGMDGARATIAGAYSTYTYSVDYEPTTGGPRVTDHKWVVQQEIADAGDARLPDGAEVTLTAEHMPGMQGAKATIHSSTDETVYMVDYEADGMRMTHHKWVVESELSPAG